MGTWMDEAEFDAGVDAALARIPDELARLLTNVVGVVAAHDRAIKLLPRRHQLTGQLPLLVAMVGFTAGGLYLLFAA